MGFISLFGGGESGKMPSINKPCRNRGCPNAQPCADHSNDKQYDQHRGSSSARGYDRRWQLIRRLKLSRDPLCERCSTDMHPVVADMAHHIRPVGERPDLRLNMFNLQSLCNDCHEIVEGRKAAR